jgi:uncharacterized protein with HEPN domain
MSRREAALLWDLIASVDSITGFIGDATLQTYLDDHRLRSAVERHLITIGEVFVRLGPDSEVAGRLGAPVRQIIGMRNTIVHGYDLIDDAVIYLTVTGDLESLRRSAARELDALESEEPSASPPDPRTP